MKTTIKFAAALLVLAPMMGASAAEVGVSVQISQPGVYGRIDIGRFPQPQLVVAQPVVITRPVVVVQQAPQPVYMWVPPGHRKNWRKHCGSYNACGVPVYFVQDQWYGQNVDPKGKGHGKGRNKDDDKDYRKGHDKGHDKDHGKGQGKGKHGD